MWLSNMTTWSGHPPRYRGKPLSLRQRQHQTGTKPERYLLTNECQGPSVQLGIGHSEGETGDRACLINHGHGSRSCGGLQHQRGVRRNSRNYEIKRLIYRNIRAGRIDLSFTTLSWTSPECPIVFWQALGIAFNRSCRKVLTL